MNESDTFLENAVYQMSQKIAVLNMTTTLLESHINDSYVYSMREVINHWNSRTKPAINTKLWLNRTDDHVQKALRGGSRQQQLLTKIGEYMAQHCLYTPERHEAVKAYFELIELLEEDSK